MDLSELSLDQLLKTVVAHEASDLHLIVGAEPQVRINAVMTPLDLPKLDRNTVQTLCYAVLTDSQKKKFEEAKELDFALDLPTIGRFRVNYYYERHNMAASFRVIPSSIPSIDSLKLPVMLKDLIKRQKGLILVTGPTGSGKTTTLAAIVHELNATEKGHIITIEDPVEFIHPHGTCIISHRSLGEDTHSFADAIKYSMRQDPDIILVGEMRDVQTIRTALTAAETGHLVMGTLHTNSAPQTISRIINVFPTDEQALIRTQLSMGLLGVISQVLMPKTSGGRTAVFEVMVNTPAIANLIRDDKLHQIYASMQIGQQQTKMQTQTQELIKAFRAGEITRESALKYASNLDEIKKALGAGEKEVTA
ncbi:MAG: type IV pilus twitching motility protein PilT [Helicobacteraceae bacterium]|jgi:twitching motility protein PilT|nr:type IV pilus twitching motility protein PilT [Helicobacteraceae bacterium]